MNVDFQDASGSLIQATFFKDAVERFEGQLKENHIYLISNGQIKYANKKFTNFDNEFSITFDKHAIVKDITEACQEEGKDMVEDTPISRDLCIESVQNLTQIYNRNQDSKQRCDLLAVVEQVVPR